MFKIGEFSKLSLVPVKTLRYYDEIGLLGPASTDRFTGYRYYTIAQLPRLNRILALKDLGFSLDQIARLLDGGLSAEHMREIMLMKQAEQQQRVRAEQERLERVMWRLKQIEQEGMMPNYEVLIKQVEPQLVASARDIVPHYPDIGRLLNEVYGYLAQHSTQGSGACAAIWHDDDYKEQDVDAEGVVPLDRAVPATERVRVYQLPAATMASVIHQGGYSSLNNAYTAAASWVNENGYSMSGPSREIYLQGPSNIGDQDDPNCVTELQFPVTRA